MRIAGNWSFTAPSLGCSHVTSASFRSSCEIIRLQLGVASNGQSTPHLMMVCFDMSTTRMVLTPRGVCTGVWAWWFFFNHTISSSLRNALLHRRSQ